MTVLHTLCAATVPISTHYQSKASRTGIAGQIRQREIPLALQTSIGPALQAGRITDLIGESEIADAPIDCVGSYGEVDIGGTVVRVEVGGGVSHERLEVCTPTDIGYALGVDVGCLEDEVVEDDDEEAAADGDGLVDHEDVEGDGDGVVRG